MPSELCLLLVQQCQEALNNISTRHAVRLYWVPEHAGLRGNEIADELARGGSVLWFFGPEPALGVSRLDIQKMLRYWLFNQHWARWGGLGDTRREGRELIPVPRLNSCPLIGLSPGL